MEHDRTPAASAFPAAAQVVFVLAQLQLESRSLLCPLEFPVTVGDDQMIEYANLDKLQWLTSLRVMIASRNVGSAAYFHSKLSAKRK
jgi:hypothetical protein